MPDQTERCEYVMRWPRESAPPVLCHAPAVLRYPAFSGGYAHLCAEHGAGHEAYSELLVDGEWVTPAAPGARGA